MNFWLLRLKFKKQSITKERQANFTINSNQYIIKIENVSTKSTGVLLGFMAMTPKITPVSMKCYRSWCVIECKASHNSIGEYCDTFFDNDLTAPLSVSTLLLILLLLNPHIANSDIKPHFSNPPNERICSKSIVSSLKIGMKGKPASEMREEGEKPREETREEGKNGRETAYRKLGGTKINTVAEY